MLAQGSTDGPISRLPFEPHCISQTRPSPFRSQNASVQTFQSESAAEFGARMLQVGSKIPGLVPRWRMERGCWHAPNLGHGDASAAQRRRPATDAIAAGTCVGHRRIRIPSHSIQEHQVTAVFTQSRYPLNPIGMRHAKANLAHPQRQSTDPIAHVGCLRWREEGERFGEVAARS